jgi:eukaryotic-like serine/threonine-protein kinase
MTLAAGARLGPYEILSALGAGGMGEVYKARDTRLERTVAVKVLPDHLSKDEDVRRRFEREAKTISQLSHPHICALYDVGNQDGVEYLVMEYLEGETLADRLAKGALPLEQTLRFGVEIADALDKAHRQGIVHRDLKPGNVMLTKSGTKLLDFGLARVLQPEAPVESLTSAPTEQKDVTREGTILGTLSYMAPEQLEGKKADARTDIFALGATIYEMATGRKAFSGESQASLISSILTTEPPPISALRPLTPPALDRVVKTCLAKDPDERWQNAGDVARELKWVGEESGAGAGAPVPGAGRQKRRERLAWAVAAAAILLGALSVALSRRPRAPEELTRFTIPPPPGQDFLVMVSLSPDARRIAFLLQDEGGRNSVGVRPLDSLETRVLRGTEDARGMFWSPDGREIAFFSDGKLKRIGWDGGPIQTICDSGGAFIGAWSRQGTILFNKEFGGPIVAVSAAGGAPRPVTAPESARGEAHDHPVFLPDGRQFVFVTRDIDPEKTSVMLGSLDSKDVRRLFHSDSAAVFAEPGYLLFARDNVLLAWRFDPGSGKLIGEPVPAPERVSYRTEDNLLSLSAAGNRLVYLSWLMRRRLVWVDRKGRELGPLGEIGGYEDVRVSPNGAKVAVTLRDPSHGQNQDVWVLDASRGTASRVTSERTDEFDPAWFPDGERLVYVSDHLGFYNLYERPASGGAEKVLVRTTHDKILPTVSPDGRHLLVSVPEGPNFTRVQIPLSGAGEPVKLSADSRFSEEHPEISPDGRGTAFDSNESGQREVYVQPLPGGPKRQVSIGGGKMPVWNRNGSELFYAGRDGTLMSVSLRLTDGRFEAGEPQPLFPLQLGLSGEIQFSRHAYDVSPDGQRFLVIRRAPDAEPDSAVVVTNWTAVLRRAGDAR